MASSSSRSSITRRLLVGAAAFQLAALIVSGSVIDGVLSRFVGDQVEKRLDAQILALASAVTVQEDLSPTLKRDLDLPPYDRGLSGWYWQISNTAGTLTSRSLMDSPIDISNLPVLGPRKERLRVLSRRVTLPDQQGTIVITAAAPESEIQEPLATARTALAWSIGALAATFLLALVAQIWLGLEPLRRISRQLADVRSGAKSALPADQPSEVKDLVLEVNGLLVQNRESLDRARAHIANLAHGLRTPLAALTVRLEDPKNKDDESVQLLGLMDRRISHHLRRARALASNSNHAETTSLAPQVRDLVEVLLSIYRAKRISTEVAIDGSISIRCDRQDLDEMIGNLLDNAFKWARSLVIVHAKVVAQTIIVTISDDGPGLTNEELNAIGHRGQRADETVAGSGFGLAISHEIAGLYGGKLDLERSISGGLSARLTLPAG